MNWDYNGYLISVHEVQDKTIHAPPPLPITHKFPQSKNKTI